MNVLNMIGITYLNNLSDEIIDKYYQKNPETCRKILKKL